MDHNTLRRVSVEQLIAMFSLRRRFVVGVDNINIYEKLATPQETDHETDFSSLDNAIRYAHQRFTETALESYRYKQTVWDKRRSRIYVTFQRWFNGEKLDKVNAFEQNMLRDKQHSELDLEQFKAEHLTIHWLPEAYDTYELVPIGTPVYWLSAQEILTGKGMVIESDAVARIDLRTDMTCADSDNMLFIHYATESGQRFHFHHQYPLADGEWFYSSINLRLFTSEQAAIEAVRALLRQMDITLSREEDTLSLTLRCDVGELSAQEATPHPSTQTTLDAKSDTPLLYDNLK